MQELELLHNFFQLMARLYHAENFDAWVGYANAANWIDEYIYHRDDLIEDLSDTLEENGIPAENLFNPYKSWSA